jgi:hypothetical protein
MDNRFYTYAWLREDGTPYYIGKGKGRRAWTQSGRKNNAKMPPGERILILKKNLTEEEAFKHEIYMIAIYGRKDLGTGILHNFSDGGEGVSQPSPEAREKIGAANRGKIRTQETREKLRASHLGKKLPLEQREKISNSLKGRVFTEEHKRKIKEAKRKVR